MHGAVHRSMWKSRHGIPECRPGFGPRAELEDAIEHVERLAHLLRVGVRAEVHGASPVALTGEHHGGTGRRR